MAAHHLHREALKWEEEGNVLIQAAKKMAILFAKMSQFMRYNAAWSFVRPSLRLRFSSAELLKNCGDRVLITSTI